MQTSTSDKFLGTGSAGEVTNLGSDLEQLQKCSFSDPAFALPLVHNRQDAVVDWLCTVSFHDLEQALPLVDALLAEGCHLNVVLPRIFAEASPRCRYLISSRIGFTWMNKTVCYPDIIDIAVKSTDSRLFDQLISGLAKMLPEHHIESFLKAGAEKLTDPQFIRLIQSIPSGGTHVIRSAPLLLDELARRNQNSPVELDAEWVKILQNWITADPNTALSFAARIQDPALRDKADWAASRAYVLSGDFEAALAWAEAISNPQEREVAIMAVRSEIKRNTQ